MRRLNSNTKLASRKKAASANLLPLCVDLDNTLIKTNTIHEAVISLFRRHPTYSAFWFISWLIRGKAYLWHRLSQLTAINAGLLPYRPEVIQFLKNEREKGREIVLISGAHQTVVESVANHLGLFDQCFGSGEKVHLVGDAKLRVLIEQYGAKSFDYIGDSPVDFCIWQECDTAYIISSNKTLIDKLRRKAEKVELIKPTGSSWIKSAFKAMRPHQWSKNLLLFAAIFLSHRYQELSLVLATIQGFIAFSLCGSAAYLLNDITDLEADRAHEKKRKRPLAAGEISVPATLVLCGLLLTGAFIGAFTLSLQFTFVLAGYFILTLLYSLYLKEKLLVDVFVLAGLYTFRVWAGGTSTNIAISHWALAFFMCLFLSLALAKRYAELYALSQQEAPTKLRRRGYAYCDLAFIQIYGCASGLLSTLVIALYLNTPDVRVYYSKPALLWFVCPLLAYWSSRLWIIASRGKLDEDPILFAVKDKVSYLVAVIIIAIVVLAI